MVAGHPWKGNFCSCGEADALCSQCIPLGMNLPALQETEHPHPKEAPSPALPQTTPEISLEMGELPHFLLLFPLSSPTKAPWSQLGLQESDPCPLAPGVGSQAHERRKKAREEGAGIP